MSEITEHRLVQEFPCYYDLYLPEGDTSQPLPKPLIVAMHGYGGDKSSMMKLVRRINERDFAIASLQGPHQHLVMSTTGSRKLGYGFGWLSDYKSEDSIALHHRFVDQVIDSAEKSGLVETSRVFLLGFSQAVGVNFRYVFTRPGKVRGVVAICGGIPSDWGSEDKYKSGPIDVLYIAAERDEYYTADRMRQNAEALKSRAGSVEFRLFDAGHEVPREAYPLINEWLLNRQD